MKSLYLIFLIIFTLLSSYSYAEVVCPDGGVCMNGYSCCKFTYGYGCCPYDYSRCCSDLKHCCPGDKKCDDVEQKCVGGSLRSEFYMLISSATKEIAITKPIKNNNVKHGKSIILESLLSYFNFTSLADTHYNITKSSKNLKVSIKKLFKDLLKFNSSIDISNDLELINKNFFSFIDSYIEFFKNENVANEIKILKSDLKFVEDHLSELIIHAVKQIWNNYDIVENYEEDIINLYNHHNYTTTGRVIGSFLEFLFNDKYIHFNEIEKIKLRNLNNNDIQYFNRDEGFLISLLKGLGLNATLEFFPKFSDDRKEFEDSIVKVINDLVFDKQTKEVIVNDLEDVKLKFNNLLSNIKTYINNSQFCLEIKAIVELGDKFFNHFDSLFYQIFVNINNHFNKIVFDFLDLSHLIYNGDYNTAGKKAAEIINLVIYNYEKSKKEFSSKISFLDIQISKPFKISISDKCKKLMEEYVEKLKEFYRTKSIIWNYDEFVKLIMEFKDIKAQCDEQ